MNTLFTILSDAMTANAVVSIFAAFAWGTLSILLSPCHLSSVPLIVGFLTTQKKSGLKQNFLLSFVFAVGILVTIAVIGLITAWMGRMMGDIGPYGKYLVAIVFLIVGLYLMGIIRLPETNIRLRPLQTNSSFLTAFVLGLLFGFALGPCTFAFMAPVLGIVFQLAGTNLLQAGLLLLAFAIGHCAVIVAVGVIATRVQKYLDWTNQSNAVKWVKRVAGALVLLGGVYTVTTI